MEYFKIFGIDPPKLNLDLHLLEKKFHSLSLENHPDRNLGSEKSERTSVNINLAYKVLRDVWARALYFLGDNALKGAKTPSSLATLYFEVQELESESALLELREKLMVDHAAREVQLLNLYKTYDSALPEAQTQLKEQIREILLENVYANSIRRDIDSKLDYAK